VRFEWEHQALAMADERGQATVEWVGLVLVAALALGALALTVPVLEGRSFGGFLAHRFACAVEMACDEDERALVDSYGERDAELVRRHLPGLAFEPGERQVPVDWRDCRAVECARVPDDRDLDAHRTEAGLRATVFTRLLRRGGRRYVQYWSYYPDSNTSFAGSDRLWERASRTPAGRVAGLGARLLTGSAAYPAYHRDDWEAVAVRVDRDGRAATRVTSHGHWQWCKWRPCRGRWGPATGWARVSRGSHAGHVPLERARERTATAEGIGLVPLEGIDRRRYRRLDADIAPPWQKEAYSNPESPES
jgi:hypothetical protein